MPGPSGFREITRTVTVTHPVRPAFAACLAFAVLCLTGAPATAGAWPWVMAGFAGAVTATGLWLFACRMFRRPEPLRSEHPVLAQRVLQIAEDSDTITSGDLQQISRNLLRDDRPRKKSMLPKTGDPDTENDCGSSSRLPECAGPA
jgi:hypothetical protein